MFRMKVLFSPARDLIHPVFAFFSVHARILTVGNFFFFLPFWNFSAIVELNTLDRILILTMQLELILFPSFFIGK